MGTYFLSTSTTGCCWLLCHVTTETFIHSFGIHSRTYIHNIRTPATNPLITSDTQLHRAAFIHVVEFPFTGISSLLQGYTARGSIRENTQMVHVQF